MITRQELENNLLRVRAAIKTAAEKAGRDSHKITLVAVTKTVPVERIIDAYQLGLTNFGENYLQEALPKVTEFHPQDVTWHMIGHVQSNKVNKILPNFHSIHTVDNVHLAQEIDQQAQKMGVTVKILLQINIAKEASKNGMKPEETISLAHEIAKLNHIVVMGLMTIPPFSQNPEDSRSIFCSLRQLRDHLRKEIPESQWEHLSMGMSRDYPVAIEEGATIIRIGQSLFGERKY